MDIPDESYLSVIEVVRRNVPFLVLDLPHVWSRWVQRTLVASDEVIIVCQPDLASLRNGKNYIDQLKAARPNDNPPRLIINMSGVPKRPEIPVKDFGAAIGVEPEVILPFEPELFGTAANNGQMISETDGGLPVRPGNRSYGVPADRARCRRTTEILLQETAGQIRQGRAGQTNGIWQTFSFRNSVSGTDARAGAEGCSCASGASSAGCGKGTCAGSGRGKGRAQSAASARAGTA